MPSLMRSCSSSREIALLAVISRKAASTCVALFMAVVPRESRAPSRLSLALPLVDQVRPVYLTQPELYLVTLAQPHRGTLAAQPQQGSFQPLRPPGQRRLAAQRHALAGEAVVVTRPGERAFHAGRRHFQ